LATPLAFNAPDGGVTLGRFPKNFTWKSIYDQRTKWLRNFVENFNLLSRVHERQTTDRQTDGRTTTYSEREREFSHSLKTLWQTELRWGAYNDNPNLLKY